MTQLCLLTWPELQARIRTVIAEVGQELRRSVLNLPLRFQMILENAGGTIEQLLSYFYKPYLLISCVIYYFAKFMFMSPKFAMFKTYMTFGSYGIYDIA